MQPLARLYLRRQQLFEKQCGNKDDKSESHNHNETLIQRFLLLLLSDQIAFIHLVLLGEFAGIYPSHKNKYSINNLRLYYLLHYVFLFYTGYRQMNNE